MAGATSRTTEIAHVVNPQRDIHRVERLLSHLGLGCALVLETHMHTDYVNGGLELAARTGGTYVLSVDDSVLFERDGVADGDELRAGRLRVTVVATPGHTDGHLSYVVDEGEGTPVAFSAGSLLYGSIGRTDFVDPQQTDELTRRSTTWRDTWRTC